MADDFADGDDSEILVKLADGSSITNSTAQEGAEAQGHEAADAPADDAGR